MRGMHLKVKHDYLYILVWNSQTLIRNVSEAQLISASISQFLPGSTLCCYVCVCVCVCECVCALLIIMVLLLSQFTGLQTVPQPSLTQQEFSGVWTQTCRQLRGVKRCQALCCEAGPPGEGSLSPGTDRPHHDVWRGPLRPLPVVAWLRNEGFLWILWDWIKGRLAHPLEMPLQKEGT